MMVDTAFFGYLLLQLKWQTWFSTLNHMLYFALCIKCTAYTDILVVDAQLTWSQMTWYT